MTIFILDYLYSPDTLNHYSQIDSENGYIVFNNLVADDNEKIEATMPFNINSFNEGLSDSNSSVKIDFQPILGSNKFSIQSINQSNVLSERRYYIGKVNHSPLKIKQRPCLWSNF